MGEELNVPAQPQAGEADPINPQGQVPTTPQAEPQAGEPKPSKSADDYERMLKELRNEAASNRVKLKKFEDEERARTEAQMTEQQKKDKQLADLQKAHDDAIRQHQEYRINSEVRIQAAQMGFADVADATRLLDWTKITYDEDGTPNNVQTLLKDLLKAKPYLAGKPAPTAQTAGGATSPARSQTQAGSGEITAAYVADVMSGKVPWRELSQEQKNAVLQWQAKNPYRF